MASGVNNKPSQGKPDWSEALVGAVQRLRAIADSVSSLDVAAIATVLADLLTSVDLARVAAESSADSLDNIDTALTTLAAGVSFGVPEVPATGGPYARDYGNWTALDSILGDAAYLDVGVAAGEVAAGDHVHTLGHFYPDAMTVDYGTLDSGTVADLDNQDGTSVVISEVAGANALRVQFDFSGLTSFNSIALFARYAGASTHELAVELWNYDTSAWDIHGYLTDAAVASWHVYTVADPTDHVSGGETQLRLRHVQSGNASHDLYLDYVSLDSAVGGGIISHPDISGRSVADAHPASAITVAFTPTNYTPASTTLEAHLQAIDTALAP